MSGFFEYLFGTGGAIGGAVGGAAGGARVGAPIGAAIGGTVGGTVGLAGAGVGALPGAAAGAATGATVGAVAVGAAGAVTGGIAGYEGGSAVGARVDDYVGQKLEDFQSWMSGEDAAKKVDEETGEDDTTECVGECAGTGQPEIARQKQDGHIKGTPANANRRKQGKPTSEFDGDRKQADDLTQEAWSKGNPVPGRPGVKDYEFGNRIGTGPNGGGQSKIRVHQDSSGRIHGHPAGPEAPSV